MTGPCWMSGEGGRTFQRSKRMIEKGGERAGDGHVRLYACTKMWIGSVTVTVMKGEKVGVKNEGPVGGGQADSVGRHRLACPAQINTTTE